MPPDAPLRAQALASPEPWRVAEAVREFARDVRRGQATADALATAIVPLATHASDDVRREVADAADALPEGAFHDVVGLLADDRHQFVAAAAARAAKSRAARRKENARIDEDLVAMASMLRDHETAYGLDARSAAERLVRRGRDLFTRRLHHELNKASTGLAVTLGALDRELEGATLDRPALVRLAAEAGARRRHLASVLERALASTATMNGVFREESLAGLVATAQADVVASMGSRADGAAFDVVIDPSITLDADRGALLQALANALHNAVEAYPRDGAAKPITVRAAYRRAKSQVELTLADRGCGMNDDMMAQLFVPFGSQKPGGTGVGMILMRTMIEEVHGGTLSLTSAPGEGTCVTMLLPRVQQGGKA
jgi:signal transduction histidine kinase